jgi:hypothetical protein
VLSSRKSKLAAVGAAGVLGALTFGGIAYAVGGDEPARSEFVTVVDEPTPGESSQPPRGGTDDGRAPRDGNRDCPEKNGGQSPSESPSAAPSAPSETPPETPSEQQPAPGSAEDL